MKRLVYFQLFVFYFYICHSQASVDLAYVNSKATNKSYFSKRNYSAKQLSVEDKNAILFPNCVGSCEEGATTIHYYGSQYVQCSNFTYLGFCRYRLKHDCNGTTIYVRRRANFGGPDDYRSQYTSWPTANDKVGATAMWCMTRVHKAFLDLFGVNSFKNFDQIEVLIDDSPMGTTEWQRTNKQMNISFFENTNSYQTTLDVMGHHYARGIFNEKSFGNIPVPTVVNLNNHHLVLAEANELMLAEGFADVMGQAVEYYTQSNFSTTSPNINDFVHGGDRPGGFNSGETRSFINPSQTGNPSVMFGPNWAQIPNSNSATAADVENYIKQNATIVSRWYYFLSMGGGGNTGAPFNYDYCVSGIGQEKAAKIAYLTATQFIQNQSFTLIGALLAASEAAASLYGVGSNEQLQTVSAWRAVGVEAPPYFIMPALNINNHTATGTESYNYNVQIKMQNFTANSGSDVTVTSNTGIEMLPAIQAVQGSLFSVYIAPACLGSARMANISNIQEEYKETVLPVNNYVEPKNEDGDFELSVIPNPTSGDFTLMLKNAVEYPVFIGINDLLGNNLYKVSSLDAYEFNFSIPELQAGMYIVKVAYKGSTYSKKIIKNK